MSTKIEWTDESWNPVSGCTPISEGCKNCYAAPMAKRLAGRYGYPKAPHEFDVTLHPNRLELPLRWKKPRMIFVNSMFDFYHPLVKCEWREQMRGVMERAPWHTYLILTKRPENIVCNFKEKNIWLGVTAENQARYDERWGILSKIKAAVKFVSIEPMLEQVWIRSSRPVPDWVIAGPETGPGARECNKKWIWGLWAQCSDACVPFFDKREPYLERKWPT